MRRLLTEDYVLISLYVDEKTPLPETIIVPEAGGTTKLRTVGDRWSYLQRTKFGANAQPFYVLLDNEGHPVLKSVSDDEFQTRLSELMRPILSFNEDESIYQIWEKMLEKREHISIIVDEYGCLRGVVSMEDVIETMTGVEIVDEDDVAVDMQALAKEKSRLMMQKKK